MKNPKYDSAVPGILGPFQSYQTSPAWFTKMHHHIAHRKVEWERRVVETREGNWGHLLCAFAVHKKNELLGTQKSITLLERAHFWGWRAHTSNEVVAMAYGVSIDLSCFLNIKNWLNL